jgi:hypothetical protein
MPDPMPGDGATRRPDVLARPIILIGAGRSGSTLFTRMLDAHPRIQFLGETSFLLPRIWGEVWEDRFWLNFPLYTALRPRSSRETPPVADKSDIDAERERVAAALRRFVCDMLKVRPDVESWGYKELWNGSDAVGRYSWESYDAVFPGATWVHLVRHPFDFLVSVARWNLHPLTKDFVVHELAHWAQMLEWNRARSAREHFLELRYEDLIRQPEATLGPILSAANVGWSDECAGALSHVSLQSSEASPFAPAAPLSRKRLKEIVASIENLERDMDRLGYDVPETFPQEIMDSKVNETLPKFVDLRSPTRTR